MTDVDRQAKLEQFREEVDGLQNVVGVAYDPERERVVALVSRKLDVADLPDDQVVANNTSLPGDEHGVEEVGDIAAHSLRIDTSEQLRPVPAGAEEQPDGRGWVGTGSIIAQVVDPSSGLWADGVSRGTVVRLSNWHVYVGGPTDAFTPHRSIRQPFRGEVVGELIGAVQLTDGVNVDVAARSVGPHDGWDVYGLGTANNGDEYGRSVVGTVTDGHAGETVTKSGRTTDVTTARIRYVAEYVDVNYGTRQNPAFVRIEDCVITTDLGRKGDSGSPVYLADDGSLCGLYFAGSDTTGVFCQVGNIRDSLGVEPITDWKTDTPPSEYGQESLQEFKNDLIEYIHGWPSS
jgi:hypothetical protein